MLKENKNRIMYIDVLRFFCLFIVFFHHFLMDVSVVRQMHDLNWLYIIVFDRKNINIGMIAIVLYFFISGISMSLSSHRFIKEDNNFDVFEFYKNRLIRLLLPFYITYILYFFLKVVTYQTFDIFNNHPPLGNIFYTFLGVDEYLNAEGFNTFSLGIGEWFLGCIIFCYLFYPFLFMLHKKNKTMTFVLMTIYFIVIQQFLFGFKTKPYTNFFNHIYNFYLGMLLIEEPFVNFIKKYKKVLILFILLFLIFLTIINNYEIPIYLNIKTTLSSLGIYILFYYCEDLFQKNKVLINFVNIINPISFEIILVHHSVIYEIDRLFGYKHVDKKLLVILFLDIVLTYYLARFVHFINKNMLKKFNKKN